MRSKGTPMTETEMARKMEELDRLLNDPDVAMEPTRVWTLLAELSVPPKDMKPATVPPPR
jgi:hypothetical protein